MDILFTSEDLELKCTNAREMVRAWGKVRAKALGKRLDDLRAAESLKAMRTLPGRCHELVGDLAGSLAVDIGQPCRLRFEPPNDPIPRLADGGLDWERVTSIRILEILDYHG